MKNNKIKIPEEFYFIDVDRISGCDYYIHLKSPILDWIQENNIKYALCNVDETLMKTLDVTMIFIDAEDAMAFKLRWL